MTIKEKVLSLPKSPGVYIMKNSDGQVIYVGKAKNLKNRVSSYFNNSAKNVKTTAMVSHVASFDYVVVPTEADSFALECNLIKKYEPFYNILLKDGKQYPYIKINLKKEYPTIEVTRKVLSDGAKYFGPYFQGVRAGELLDLIFEAFPLRSCKLNLDGGKTYKRACLNHSLGKCLAPCIHKVSKEKYAEIIKDVTNFLNGDTKKIETVLADKMTALSETENFEGAIVLRDKLSLIQKIKQRAVNILPRKVDVDVFSLMQNERQGVITYMAVRGGKLMGVENFPTEGAISEGVLESFLPQFYATNKLTVNKILVNQIISEASGLEAYLSPEKNLTITKPVRGDLVKLLKEAEHNGQEYLDKNLDKLIQKEHMTTGACESLKEALGLSRVPRRIECFDISHIQGTNKVASMVVFIGGEPAKKHYRKFKIKTVLGNNDFASLHETLSRRIAELGGKDVSFSSRPDLLVIDGGKGQLSSTVSVLEEQGISDVDIISLAEKNEEVFVPYNSEPVILSRSSYALKLLQRIRDEAHRFAITFHRSLRRNDLGKSELDNIAGLGKQKQKAIIKHFGSLKKVKQASVKDLCEVSGIGKVLAEEIYNYFHK